MDKPLTLLQLADALEAAWNPLISAAHDRQAGMDAAVIVAEGLNAVAARLRDLAASQPAPAADTGQAVAWRYRYNGQWYLSQTKSFAMQGFDLEPLYTHPAPLDAERVKEAWVLGWTAAPRPPAHPRAMTGSSRFETFDKAMAFMGQQASDATFVSLTRERVLTSDWSDAARAALRQKEAKP